MTFLLVAALTMPCDWRCLRAVTPTRAECRAACETTITACQAALPGDQRWCRRLNLQLCRLFGVRWCQGGLGT